MVEIMVLTTVLWMMLVVLFLFLSADCCCCCFCCCCCYYCLFVDSESVGKINADYTQYYVIDCIVESTLINEDDCDLALQRIQVINSVLYSVVNWLLCLLCDIIVLLSVMIEVLLQYHIWNISICEISINHSLTIQSQNFYGTITVNSTGAIISLISTTGQSTRYQHERKH